MTHTTDLSHPNSLVKLGGSLGIAAAYIGMAVFLAGMFGIWAVFMLSILPLLLGGLGLVLTIVGAVLRTHAGSEETAPISAIFCCAFGIIFGLIEWGIWMAPIPTPGAAPAAH